jgi:hypothetical protein
MRTADFLRRPNVPKLLPKPGYHGAVPHNNGAHAAQIARAHALAARARIEAASLRARTISHASKRPAPPRPVHAHARLS